MKKLPLTIFNGKVSQLQLGDWVGPKSNISASAPTVSNDSSQGYEAQSKWTDTASGKEYTCIDASIGAAVWVDTTAAGGGGGGGTLSDNVAFFEPDIGSSVDNHYKTWAEVMVAVASWGAVGGRIVVHKPGIFTVAPVPAGTYDLSYVIISNSAATVLAYLDFADGTTLSGLPKLVEGIQLRNNNTSAPLHSVVGFGLLILRDATILNEVGASQPAISNPIGAQFNLTIDSQINPLYKNGGASEPVFNEGSFNITIKSIPSGSFYTTNDIFTNALSGNGTITINSFVLLPGGYTATYTNYDGNFVLNDYSELRVQEKIDAVVTDVAVFNDEYIWRKRGGVTLSPSQNDYLTLGFLPSASATTDYVPADSAWAYDVMIFAYHRGTPTGTPLFISKTFKYVIWHDSTTGNVTATLTEVASAGSLPITVTAGGTGAAPQHPHIFVQNDDTHNIAVEWKFSRMKNTFPVTNT